MDINGYIMNTAVHFGECCMISSISLLTNQNEVQCRIFSCQKTPDFQIYRNGSITQAIFLMMVAGGSNTRDLILGDDALIYIADLGAPYPGYLVELQSAGTSTAISWVSNAAPPGAWDKGCPFNSLTFKNVYWKIISYKTGILNSSSY